MAISMAASRSASRRDLAAVAGRDEGVAQHLAAGAEAAGAQLLDQVGDVLLLGQADAEHGHADALEGGAQVAELRDEVGAQVAREGGRLVHADPREGGGDQLGLARRSAGRGSAC